MSTSTASSSAREALYHGLRMTAEEYLQLEDDGFRYELIDGVVCMSPSPTPVHQKVSTHLAAQIVAHLQTSPVGEVFVEIDVNLGEGPRGRDLVYRPDVVFIRAERAAQMRERIVGPPDLVVEVVSNTSRRYDNETKKGDYERCGVPEYWIIDPEQNRMTFYRLDGKTYVEVKPDGDALACQVVPGFTLDLDRVRKTF